MEAQSTWRRAAAAAMPAAVPALTVPVFRYTVRRFGKRRGYQAGFGAYWALCWSLALAVAGRRRHRRHQRVGRGSPVAGRAAGRLPGPENPRLALASLGFTGWHLVPLSVRPHPRGRRPVLLGAGLIGFGYGWAARESGSLAYVSLAHAATDSCGVRAARSAWLPPAAGQG